MTMESQENDVNTEGARENGKRPLKELLSVSDPDLLGGHSCVLLELLSETRRVSDHVAKRQQLKTTLERIETWSIPQARADAVFCSLWDKNGAIEVWKKAKELFPAQFRETESDTVQWEAERDQWKVELLKGIVFKMVKEIDGLDQEAQELKHEVGQKNTETEAIRRKTQELEDEVREKNMEIQLIRRKIAVETELTVTSMAATTRKAKEDELRIEFLQKQLTETEARVASMEATTMKEKTKDKLEIEEASSRLLTLVKIIREMSYNGESEVCVDLLHNKLAEKSEELLEMRKVGALADKLSETDLKGASKLGEMELDRTFKPAEEDSLKKEDSEDCRAAKRAKVEHGAEDSRMESVGDEDEADGKYRSENGGPSDKSNVNNSNHVQCGVGTNSVEEEVDGRSLSGDGHVAERKDVDELQGGPATERKDGDDLQGMDFIQKDDGDELQGGLVTERNSKDELQGGHVTERNDGNELQAGARDGDVTEKNDGDEFQGGHVAERNDRDELQASGAAKKMDIHSSNSVEILQRAEDFAAAREPKLLDTQTVTPKIEKLTGNSLQPAQSPLSREECHQEGEEFSKLVDISASKSPPGTIKMRMGLLQVPVASQSLFNEDGHALQQPVSNPITFAPSHNDTPPSSGKDSELAISSAIPVPDPDFHDFDSSRMETDIRPGQIWAIYDDHDGMPRFYARINAAQTKPFKADLNWLEHCPADGKEFTSSNNTGRAITCGDFKIGKSVAMDSINLFSHCVVDKISMLKIYPQKGQVWAVYMCPEQVNGPAGGPRSHVEESTLEYEMVEILSKFCNKNGLRTGTLEKVLGFKTLFRRQEGIESLRSFKPEELPKFSHFVPSHRFEDSETDAHDIPHESLELDPAATPPGVVTSPSDPSRVQSNAFQARGGSTIEGTEAHGRSEGNRKWVKLLKPIACLPTNVGSRIRSRVRDALEADPPEWAAKLLEQSISRAVYKGNAAGPTKRIVVKILDKVRG